MGKDHFNYFLYLLWCNFSPVCMFQTYSKRTNAHGTNTHVLYTHTTQIQYTCNISQHFLTHGQSHMQTSCW